MELEKLTEYFRTQEIRSIVDLRGLTNDYINRLDLNEVEKKYLEEGIMELDEDFQENY